MRKVKLNSKAEEVQHLRRFYEALPEDSYLRGILEGIVEEAQRMIENDWAYSVVEAYHETQAARLNAELAAGKHREEAERLKKEVCHLREQVLRLRAALEEAQEVIAKYRRTLLDAMERSA